MTSCASTYVSLASIFAMTAIGASPAFAATRSYIANGYDSQSKVIYYDPDTSSGPGAEAYFPFGYFLEPSGSNTGKLVCVRDLMGPAGFDVTFSPSGASGEVDKIPALMDQCRAHSITLLAGTYTVTRQDAFLNRTSTVDLMAMPGLLGWYHTDDANDGYPDFGTGTHGYPVDTVDARDAYVKSRDASHVTSHSLTSGCTNQMRTVYAPVADFVGQQDYPMGNRTDNWDFWQTFEKMQSVTQAASAAGTVPYAFTQSFTQGTHPKFPTAPDADLQVYLSVCAGVKGIYFYSYRDNMATSYPEFWEKTKQLCAEVRSGEFGRAILFGKRTGVRLNEDYNGHLYPKYYGIWEHAASTYVVAINMDPITPRAISISLPASAQGAMTRLFAYRTASLSYDAGLRRVSGTLPPQAVEVYVVRQGTGAGTGRFGSSGVAVSGLSTPRFDLRGRVSRLPGAKASSQTTVVDGSVLPGGPR